MYIPIGVKTDHSLLKSMIKIDHLITFLKEHNITSCGICDDNLNGAIEFYDKCKKNQIKPIIGLSIIFNNHEIYLYTKDYYGYLNLLKLNTLKQQEEITINHLEKYSRNLICVIPYLSKKLYSNFNKIYQDTFLSYTTEYEKNNALIITSNLVFLNIIKALNIKDLAYLKYLDMISSSTTITSYQKQDYSSNYYLDNTNEEDIKSTYEFIKLINLEISYQKRYIPKYNNLDNPYLFLKSLAYKGLLKRLNNKKDLNYLKRLDKELQVIKDMGFVDYFLIVYDYILFAKKNNILVGPGRGSAAGCLVAYTLGITDIDPLKYDLLFERFLNKERITMPDIDIDFEDLRRAEVIDYLKEKYGQNNVANIMTYSSLTSKQVLKDVARILEVEEKDIAPMLKLIEAKMTLSQNLKSNLTLQNILKTKPKLKLIYQIALKLEGLKRQVSTHAAGVVIANKPIDEIIPLVYNSDNILTGCTMEYLENLGLIKMDILSIRNLRTIHEVLDLIKEKTNQEIKLSTIPLNDPQTLDLFKTGNTVGIFQFESEGMKNFLTKLKPNSFEDLIAAIALFRPGPMANIDEFIKRKEGKAKITYPDPTLKDILQNTYGIIVYQEQIMQILVKMANFSFYEADNIRRAMSKKKKDIMEKARDTFIKQAILNHHEEKKAIEVFDLILKFANYGFNKSHSVAYALVGYQMAYLKAHYPLIFYANLLNMSIASEIKTNEYLQVVKQNGLKLLNPNINKSGDKYQIIDNYLLLPLGVIKNLGQVATEEILKERQKGEFTDFFDFTRRCYGKSITKKVIEVLIYAGAFQEFNQTKQTLIQNIDSAICYAELTSQIDSPLILKPSLELYPEYANRELILKEKEALGFYISNHPTSIYQNSNFMKLINIKNYFDKYIKCVVLVNRLYSVNTKKGEKMYFITAEDETALADLVIFPNKNTLVTKFKKDEVILVTGKVERRLDKYQIVVSNIEKVK